jgi:prevent-host-death family protein
MVNLTVEEEIMESVTALEAKTRFGQLLERVAQGEEVIITRHEKPVARLVPEGCRNLKSVREAVAGIRELRRQIYERNKGKRKVSAAEVKSWIGEGRR